MAISKTWKSLAGLHVSAGGNVGAPHNRQTAHCYSVSSRNLDQQTLCTSLNKRFTQPLFWSFVPSKRFWRPLTFQHNCRDGMLPINLLFTTWCFIDSHGQYSVTTMHVSNWTRYQKYNGRGKGRVATLESGWFGQVGRWLIPASVNARICDKTV